MQEQEFLDIFRQCDALLEGHFLLSSGLHSNQYWQCAKLLMHPAEAEKVCAALADKIRKETGEEKPFDYVIAPAMGGLFVGYEMARALGVPSMFVERVDGSFELRRGFEIPQGAKVLVSEDVVSTGLSAREAFKCIEANGGKVAGVCSLVDRSGGDVDFGVPFFNMISRKVPAWEADNLPPELAGTPAIKPGSRGLKK